MIVQTGVPTNFYAKPEELVKLRMTSCTKKLAHAEVATLYFNHPSSDEI
jgi:hypothetical protein